MLYHNYRLVCLLVTYASEFLFVIYRYFFLINVFVILIQAEGVIDIFYDVLGKKCGMGIDWFSFTRRY